MTGPVVPVAPAEAARRAAWWRTYAARPEATDDEREGRLATAEAYQAMACTSYVADRHDGSEARDE